MSEHSFTILDCGSSAFFLFEIQLNSMLTRHSVLFCFSCVRVFEGRVEIAQDFGVSGSVVNTFHLFELSEQQFFIRCHVWVVEVFVIIFLPQS